MNTIRTLEEFVEDGISYGRSLTHILAVAENSRWSNEKEEIKKIFNNFQKNLKKINIKTR